MSDDGGSGDKTEEPTPERLRKLREDGNIPKSQDVIQALMFVACFCVLAATIGFSGEKLSEFMRLTFSVVQLKTIDSSVVLSILLEGLKTMLLAGAPVIAVAFFVALASNYAQVGFL